MKILNDICDLNSFQFKFFNLVMGLGPRLLGFLSWGLCIVCFALLSDVFCLDFRPLFFLLLFPCWVFFL